jgi:hypothetical protein
MWFEFPDYVPAATNDIEIVIAFFSPCNYRRPRQNMLRVAEKIARAKYPTLVVEAIFPGAEPLVLPAEIRHKQIHVGHLSALFLKENLYNLALADTTQSKIVFMDNDIEFSDPYWLNKTATLLDTHDAVQPFDVCYWLDDTNTKYTREKLNCVQPILEKTTLSGARHHPGFVWAFRRDFLTAVGGFYDMHPFGGGDTAFWYSLVTDNPPDDLLKFWGRTNEYFAETKMYKEYRQRIQAFSPRLNYIAGNVLRHFWHGTIDNRQYVSRNLRYMPELQDGDFPLRRNSDGILEWLNPAHADTCLEYFRSRKEDG